MKTKSPMLDNAMASLKRDGLLSRNKACPRCMRLLKLAEEWETRAQDTERAFQDSGNPMLGATADTLFIAAGKLRAVLTYLL